jgi:deazaflavin-dependent oxidoreductase (nitroreductase family)
MPIEGEYVPSTWDWVADQVEEYESSGGTTGLTQVGQPVVIVTMRGHKSGKVRKAPVMRVEHGGAYAAIASKGGDDQHPGWYHNIVADPHVTLQDGPAVTDMVAREVQGDERAAWWQRALEVWPSYADYEKKTSRLIPVFVLEPAG